jgi:NADH:ubiquinone oxidoreductase subunit 6 (subunit J)
MTPQQILFIVFGVITVGAALALVTRRNVFHAALFMILSFFGVAGIYVLLEAPFLAAVQLFIYVGGISILMIMAIMVTRDMMSPETVAHTRQWLAAAVVSVALCAVLIWVILGHGGWAAAVSSSGSVPEESIAILGNTLVDAQGLALPFEVASVLLLVALIGAATIVRER